ncbi:MAG: terpene cyclase/mutase family protein [Gemmataceae bacterium]|nr:terpene cyclase/mutase family protein [Gemmataceae bacterium]
MNRRQVLGVTAAGLYAFLRSRQGAIAADAVGPDAKVWNGIVDKAIAYLKTSQDSSNGSWSKGGEGGKNLGVTGVVVTGLLQTGRVAPNEAPAAKGIEFIESLVNKKDGHIAGQDAKPQLLNYVTSVNVMALKEANRDKKYAAIIGKASDFLKKLQWDEEEGKNQDNDFYGGAGYDSNSRPDLSNTQMFLDALKAAGVPPDDPAFKRAVIFVSRCQNLKGEANKAPWAGKINDGSFIYSAANGGQTKADTLKDGGLVGYGSMTYAGIKSLIYCGVSKDDERVKKAVAWIGQHYTLDFNPGMPKLKGHQGLYYYYHTMAKCLEAVGLDTIEDADKKKHDWRAEITDVLAKKQSKDGSWVNDLDSWMEGDPNLVTGYALMALSHCKPKK